MHVIFVAPHFPANQREFVRALQQVGARVTGIGDAPVEHLPAEVKRWLDDYVYVPRMLDEEALEAAVKHIQRKGWVDRLEATIETHMLPVANVREHRGIPGLSPEQVLLCRDKAIMKDFLRERGIPCAASTGLRSTAEALAFAERVGFPLIVKPRAGAGAHGTTRVDNAAELQRCCAEFGLDRGGSAMVEEFNEGHEGFFDTVLLNGEVMFEAITHYYPNVLPAMRARDINPYIVTDNRIDRDAYDDLRQFGRKVIAAMQLRTTPTHMEWFFGPKGLRFSEIGARPPGVCFWDVYCGANEFDVYSLWAETLVHGRVTQRPSRRFAAGLIALRPNRDGRITGYSGIEEMQRKYGENVFKAHLPPAGMPTQPVEAGYMANAWVMLRHPDFDTLRGIMEDVGNGLKVWAQ